MVSHKGEIGVIAYDDPAEETNGTAPLGCGALKRGPQPLFLCDEKTAQNSEPLASSGTISRATMLMILISGFTAGPAVSL